MTHIESHSGQAGFEGEQLYIKVRKLEERIYSDEEVKKLPTVHRDHRHQQEWKIRAGSFSKLKQKLERKKTSLKILDVGCGNGWMSHRLSEISNSKITGLDLNLLELEQAKRVFHDLPNINFVYGNLYDDIFQHRCFDVIIVAGAIQYFANLRILVERLFYFLKPQGELFIMDSPIYKENEVAAARERSNDYYEKLKVPGMIDHYFHHSWNELSHFNYSILNRTLFNIFSLKILRNKSLIFPLITITNIGQFFSHS